jgi:hypothetical protein
MSALKDKIISNIKFAQDRGFTIVSDNWGNDPTKCACALGCVLIANEYMISEDPEDNAQVVAELLSVEDGWVEGFIYGFDYDLLPDSCAYGEAWRLGRAIRDEVNPMYHSEYVNNLDPMAVEFIAASEI